MMFGRRRLPVPETDANPHIDTNVRLPGSMTVTQKRDAPDNGPNECRTICH
jgi:hypothetical protein